MNGTCDHHINEQTKHSGSKCRDRTQQALNSCIIIADCVTCFLPQKFQFRVSILLLWYLADFFCKLPHKKLGTHLYVMIDMLLPDIRIRCIHKCITHKCRENCCNHRYCG